jgi:hypothetical protein
MNKITFSFSDTIAGYVKDFQKERDTFALTTSDGREFSVKFSPSSYAWIANNLEEPRQWCGEQMRGMLTPGRFLFAYGTYYSEGGGFNFEAQYRCSSRPSRTTSSSRSRTGGSGRSRPRELLPQGPVRQGRGGQLRQLPTTITLTGEKAADHYRQETDTISRLVYGFATAFMLTGDDRYLEGAERGTEYLREHMRFYDQDENIVYWYHGIDVHGAREDKVFASEFGDDFDAIPAYEQIYALAGPIQTYRITGDPRILRDAELTVDLFDRFFLDTELGGYFSHLDPIMLDARSESLGPNRGKKNWNRWAITPRPT